MVITGLGTSPGLCVGKEQDWLALTTDAPESTHRKIIGFNPRTGWDRRHAQRTALFSQIAIAAGLQAYEDAGSPTDDKDAIAVVLGAGNGGAGTLIQGYLDFQRGGGGRRSAAQRGDLHEQRSVGEPGVRPRLLWAHLQLVQRLHLGHPCRHRRLPHGARRLGRCGLLRRERGGTAY